MSKRRIDTTYGDPDAANGMRRADLAPDELEAKVRAERAEKAGIELRCPKPRYRWKPTTPGPCGRKLGEMFPVGPPDDPTVGAADIVIFAPIEQLRDDDGRWVPHYRLLKEPSSGHFVEQDGSGLPFAPTTPVGMGGPPGAASQIVLQGDADRFKLDCPRCGVTSDLLTLTGRRLLS